MKKLLGKFEFNTANAGWTGAMAAAFFALAPVNDAQAQSGVHTDFEEPVSDIPKLQSYNLRPDANQQRALEAKSSSEEGLDLSEYFQFIDVMKKEAGGSCCHMKDGIKPYEIVETGDPAIPYQAIVNTTRSGLRLAEPITIDIPAAIVITPEHALSRCEPFVEAAEANGIEHSCTPPPFSILWYADHSSFNSETGKHIIFAKGDYPRMEVDADYVVPADQYNRSSISTRYCFWPEPSAF